MKWNKDLKIDEKFKKFHGCMLTIKLIINYMMTTIDRFSFEPVGPIVDLFKSMAHVGNFTYNYQLVSVHNLPNNQQFVEEIPKDGMMFNHNAFLQMAVLAFSAIGQQIHFLTLFAEEKVTCLLTPGEPYDSYEKLLFPFDFWTWILLLFVFGCSFLSIFLIGLFPDKIKDAVYGDNVITPAQNVGSIFFGMSLTQVSLNNSPRIILITFILFCLVIRTAYQGVLFELIAADIRKPLPQTFHELYIKNYSIHAIDMIETSLKEFISEEDL